MGIRIIVDSTADLTPQQRKRVTVVPLTIHFGEEEFVDGVNITNAVFYQKLENAKVLPTTSQASPYAFSAAFGQAVADGDEVVAIVVSSRLSGTYQSAIIAAEDYPDKIHVVDTRNIYFFTTCFRIFNLNTIRHTRKICTFAKTPTFTTANPVPYCMVHTLSFNGNRLIYCL